MVADVTPFFKRYNKLNDVFKQGDTYWLAMSDGVFVLSGKKLATVASGMYANCIIRGRKDILLFGTRKGVKLLHLDKKASHDKSLKPYLSYDVVSGYYDVDTQLLWLGTNDQGVMVTDARGTCTSVGGIPHNPIRSIVCYDTTTMLVGIDGCGVYQAPRQPSSAEKGLLLFNVLWILSGWRFFALACFYCLI